MRLLRLFYMLCVNNKDVEHMDENYFSFPCLLRKKCLPLQRLFILNQIYMETTRRQRTREEVCAAFKESMRRKKEWIEESNAFLERIQKQRLAGQI